MSGTAEKRIAASTDRRRRILQAAAAVFSERGFHRTRVSDIAQRAGVAHGLIYHYFKSKDDVLNCLFEDNWQLFMTGIEALRDDGERSAADKLAAICTMIIDALQIAPSTIQVIIQEVVRSDRLSEPDKVGAFGAAFCVVRSIIAKGQAAGELRPTVDAEVAAFAFLGALETICTGFVLKAVGFDHRDAERVKATVVQMTLSGLCVPEEGP